MEMLKKVTLIGCLLGIAFSMVELAAPSEKMKKQIKIVTSVVLLISVMTPFLKDGLVISVSAPPDFSTDRNAIQMEEQVQQAYSSEINNSLERRAQAALQENGITVDNLCIVTETDEYNFLKVKEITMSVDRNSQAAAIEVLTALFGSDIEVGFE